MEHELQNSLFALGSLGWQEEHCPACGKLRFGLQFDLWSSWR